MKLKRITRLLKLLQTLQSGQGQNAKGLAGACGVTRRTIFRDLETLKAAGVPLEFDADSQRYMIPTAFFLPPTNLTAAEALSLIAVTSELGADSGLPFLEPARTAALKLESSLPAALRDELRAMTRSIHIRTGPTNPLDGKEAVYQQLIDAIAGRRVVRIEYASLTEWEKISTKLRPYRLMFSRRSWFVIGRSSAHRDVRTFNVGRIDALKPLREKYVIPKSFSLDKYLGNAWNLIPGNGADHQVVIRFQPLVAQNVAEVVWHQTQELRPLKDGSLEFKAQVSGLSEIAWWVLGYGDQAEVIKPARLRKIVASRVRQMQAMYNGSSK